MSDNMIKGSLYRDKNGVLLQVVDQEARNKIGELSEEIGNVSSDVEAIKNATANKPFTETGDIVTFNGVEGSDISVVGDAEVESATTVTLTHCGKNVIDMSKFTDPEGIANVYDNGWLVLGRNQDASAALEYKNAFLLSGNTLRPGKKYDIYLEVSADTQLSTTEGSFRIASEHSSEYIATSVKSLVNPLPGGKYKLTVAVNNPLPSTAYVRIRSFFAFPVGCYGVFKYRLWVHRADDDAIETSAFTLADGAEYEQYAGETYTIALDAGHTGKYEWSALTAKAGVNNVAVSPGTVTVSGETPGSGVIVAGESKFDASKYNIPIVYLSGDTSSMTKDNAVTLNYKYGDLTGTCTCKWQGSSSLSWPKKNYTVTFDNAFEAKEGWGAQKKYCFKANFIDHSHCRNVVSCKLWGEIVKSRSGAPTELKNLPNGGAIDGFPCVIVLNDEFHGLYMWNIPKDGWMFGSPKAILCADAHVDATRFKALATLNGDFELEYVEDEDNADWVLNSINTAIQAVLDSDGSDLDTTVNQYIDIASAIDYYIHTVDEAAADATDKNYILVTFDGVKWYFSAYDRDTVYGLDWDGKKFFAPNVGTTYENYADLHRLMGLIRSNKAADLKARAIALRNGVKSEANVTNVFTNFATAIPSQILDEDARKWPTIPATTTSNIWQILNWYRLRRIMLDAQIDAIA